MIPISCIGRLSALKAELSQASPSPSRSGTEGRREPKGRRALLFRRSTTGLIPTGGDPFLGVQRIAHAAIAGVIDQVIGRHHPEPDLPTRQAHSAPTPARTGPEAASQSIIAPSKRCYFELQATPDCGMTPVTFLLDV